LRFCVPCRPCPYFVSFAFVLDIPNGVWPLNRAVGRAYVRETAPTASAYKPHVPNYKKQQKKAGPWRLAPRGLRPEAGPRRAPRAEAVAERQLEVRCDCGVFVSVFVSVCDSRTAYCVLPPGRRAGCYLPGRTRGQMASSRGVISAVSCNRDLVAPVPGP
jgi:hypothetical protein